jgi:hypothetical protein
MDETQSAYERSISLLFRKVPDVFYRVLSGVEVAPLDRVCLIVSVVVSRSVGTLSVFPGEVISEEAS